MRSQISANKIIVLYKKISEFRNGGLKFKDQPQNDRSNITKWLHVTSEWRSFEHHQSLKKNINQTWLSYLHIKVQKATNASIPWIIHPNWSFILHPLTPAMCTLESPRTKRVECCVVNAPEFEVVPSVENSVRIAIVGHLLELMFPITYSMKVNG